MGAMGESGMGETHVWHANEHVCPEASECLGILPNRAQSKAVAMTCTLLLDQVSQLCT